MFCAIIIDSTISVVDQELFIADLDPTFWVIPDPDKTLKQNQIKS